MVCFSEKERLFPEMDGLFSRNESLCSDKRSFLSENDGLFEQVVYLSN